ncbi:hypothetical protein ALC60_01625, partial [Trachymyrmex zeteki]
EDVTGYSLDPEEVSLSDATSPAAVRDGTDGLGDDARTCEYRSLALQQVSHGTSCRASHCKGGNHGDDEDGDDEEKERERMRGVLRARGKRSGDENTPSGVRIARTRAHHAIWVTRRAGATRDLFDSGSREYGSPTTWVVDDDPGARVLQ